LAAVAAFTALGAFGAYAADPMEPDFVMEDDVDTSFVTSVYFQVLGGVALESDLIATDANFDPPDVSDPFPYDHGWAVAGTAGVVVVEGLSVEADVLHTRRVSTDDTSIVTTTSLMANIKGTAHLNEMFSLYAAVGVGLVHINFIDPAGIEDDAGANGFGYQLIAGAAANVTENVALVGEARFQDTFGHGAELTDQPDVFVRLPTVSLLGGVRVGF
jgi:opacity protein-like surface antigen